MSVCFAFVRLESSHSRLEGVTEIDGVPTAQRVWGTNGCKMSCWCFSCVQLCSCWCCLEPPSPARNSQIIPLLSQGSTEVEADPFLVEHRSCSTKAKQPRAPARDSQHCSKPSERICRNKTDKKKEFSSPKHSSNCTHGFICFISAWAI